MSAFVALESSIVGSIVLFLQDAASVQNLALRAHDRDASEG